MILALGFRVRWVLALNVLVVTCTNCVAVRATVCAVASPNFAGGDDDSAAGLKRVAQDALSAAKAGDRTKLLAITRVMVLPYPDTWFARVFGGTAGRVLAEQYRNSISQMPEALANNFATIAALKLNQIQIFRYTRSCTDLATDHIYPILAARKTDEPLSSIQFGYSDEAKVFHYFAYVDGAFRFLGKLDSIPIMEVPTPGVSIPRRIWTEAPEFMSAKRLDQVRVEYPVEARNRHISGKVKLRVVIGTDGSVRDVQVASGRCILAEPAVRAARQFKYSLVSQNGESVEVETIVYVNFSLSVEGGNNP